MPRTLLHIKHWPSWFAVLVFRLFALLPLPAQFGVARWLGLLAHHLLKRRRHIAEVNIHLCFPELNAEQQAQLVRDNFISTAYGVVELGLCWWASDQKILAISQVSGMEKMQEVQQQGRGVLLLGAHFTSLDLSGRVLGIRCKADATYKEQRNPVFDYMVLRSRQGFVDYPIRKNAMRQMIKRLKNGHIVWHAPDQDFGSKGSVFVPFFHHPAATLANIGKIIKLSNAKVLFYSHFRKQDEQGRLYWQGEIFDPFKDGFGEDETANAALFNRALADVIRQHPEQYLWLHERFRTQELGREHRPYTIRKKKKKH